MTGTNGLVSCFTSWEDDLIVGGPFSALGSVPANLVARQIGDQEWVGMGDGLEGLDIGDFVVFEGQLYTVCRKTSSTMGVYRFDEDQWTQLGVDLPSVAKALAVYHDQLYVGGFQWTGGGWLETMETDGQINDLIVVDDLLIAGGNFETANGMPTGSVYGWDGTQIHDAYPGQTETVNAFALWHDELYLARECRTGASFDAGVQCWRDESWADILELGGIHYFRPYRDLIATPDALLVCGDDHPPIIKSAQESRLGEAFIKSWDGSSMVEPFAVEDAARFSTIFYHDDALYLGGGFSSIGTPLCHHLGRVENNALHAVCPTGLGANSTINHFLPSQDGLVIGGYFYTIAGMLDQGVALYDDGEWQSLSLALADFEDFQRMPTALAWHEGALSAMVTGHASLSMAYWDGMQWIIPQPWDWVTEVFELRSWHGMLLGLAGNQVLDYSTYMDPTVYLEFPFQSYATSSLIDGGDLIVGGHIPNMGGVSLNHIGRFDGDTWSTFSGGLPAPVHLLGRYQGQIIAAFGPEDALDITVWDGDSWSTLPVLYASNIYAMQEYQDHLFVAGRWRLGGDEYAFDLRYLDGDAWVSVGDIDGQVKALGVVDDELWIGGRFTMVDNVPAANLVTMTMEITPVEDGGHGPGEMVPSALRLASPTPNPFNPMTVVSYTLAEDGVVKLEVFNLKGQLVTTLMSGHQTVGRHQVTWNGTGQNGQALPSGSYLLRLDTGRQVRTSKATLVR